MTTHIMLDIETLGTRPGAVILSAALVRFTDEVYTTVNLSISEQQALDLTVDPATAEWWHGQDPAAWAAATQNPLSILAALDHLSAWYAWAAGGDALVWCHGATFDAPLIEELYRRAGRAAPWHFAEVRDTRTLYDLAGVDVKQYAVPPPHVALNDAIGQTRAAVAAMRVVARDRGVAAA